MYDFETELRPGGKTPYDTWTFLVLPDDVADALGSGRHPVRGELAGERFRGTLARGEGVMRMPVPAELRDAAGVRAGDVVHVTLELDPEPRPVEVPDELQAVLDADPELARLFEAMAPSHRRAWAAHVSEAKRAGTRERRAARAIDGIRTRSFPR